MYLQLPLRIYPNSDCKDIQIRLVTNLCSYFFDTFHNGKGGKSKMRGSSARAADDIIIAAVLKKEYLLSFCYW
jgi:hypothetical protein